MPRTAYILSSEKMGSKAAAALWAIMKPLIESGAIEVMEVPGKSTGTRKYSTSAAFDTFWESLDTIHKKAKPRASQAHSAAVQRGHSAETIEAGVHGYLKDELARRMHDGKGYKPLHPATWLNDDRFLETQSNHPDTAIKSKWDLVCDEAGELLKYEITGANRSIFLELIQDSTITLDMVRNNAGTWEEDDTFVEWLKTLIK